jgi:GT2 family glycosyltransferase
MPPEIAVIVVNYGTADLAIEAVESVLVRQHGGRSIEVHLVDNSSPGRDAERLRKAHGDGHWGSRVHLHMEAINHGFGGGNNVVLTALAAREAPPDKVFLLNPDARVANEAIDELAAFLDEHPDVAAAGAAIRKPEGTPETAAFRFPTILGEFEKVLNFGPVSRLLVRWRIPLSPNLPRSQVDWVSGAAVMLRFASLKQIGFFDPDYFLYYEEVDLMRALARKGWKTWYIPEAQVVHHEGAATGASSARGRERRPAYVYHSWRLYFLKNHGRGYAILTSILVVLAALSNQAISRIRQQQPWLPLHYVQDHVRLALLPLLKINDGRQNG